MTPRLLLALPLIGASLIAHAAGMPPAAHAETEALLGRLAGSGCSFNRNGSWYDGQAARDHLQQKLDYLEGKGLVGSTEQFIERGASASSLSGKPYLVRCGTAQPVESRAWLTTHLQALRASAAAPASAPTRH